MPFASVAGDRARSGARHDALARRELGPLPIGSEQRRAYLFGLASDPAVLNAQAAPKG